MDTPNKTILEKIKSIFAEANKTKLEEVKTKDGVVIFAEVFDVGEAVFVVDGEERIPLPIGEYVLEDGKVLVVEEEGIIASISEGEVVEEEVPEEPEAEVEAEEDKEKERIKDIMKEIMAELHAEEMQKVVDDMQKAINEMKSDLSEQITDVITEMAKTPAGDTPKRKPKGKVAEAKLRAGGRSLTTQERIYSRLYKNY